jgi:hypothetical protein
VNTLFGRRDDIILQVGSTTNRTKIKAESGKAEAFFPRKPNLPPTSASFPCRRGRSRIPAAPGFRSRGSGARHAPVRIPADQPPRRRRSARKGRGAERVGGRGRARRHRGVQGGGEAGRQARAYILCVRRTVGKAEVVRAAVMSVGMERREGEQLQQSDRSRSEEAAEGEGKATTKTKGKVGDDGDGGETPRLSRCRGLAVPAPTDHHHQGRQPTRPTAAGNLATRDGDGRAIRCRHAVLHPRFPPSDRSTARARHVTAERCSSSIMGRDSSTMLDTDTGRKESMILVLSCKIGSKYIFFIMTPERIFFIFH